MGNEMRDDRGAAERAMLYARNENIKPASEPEEAKVKQEANSQIIKLLQQVRTRLTDIERERTEMWDSLQEQSKILTELEDRSTSTEKSYLSISNRISRNELSEAPFMERLDEIERAQKEGLSAEKNEELRSEIIGRLEESDLQTARLIERIDEAMAMQTRMNRRIDKVVQDKQRLNRKISLLEESVDATRNALSAKAMVLLTDKGVIGQTDTPRIPLFHETDSDEDIFGSKDLKNSLPKEDDPIFTAHKTAQKKDHSFRNQALAASVFVLVAATAGWFISQNINSLQQNATISDYQVERYTPPKVTEAKPSYESEVIAQSQKELTSNIKEYAQSPTPNNFDYAFSNNTEEEIAAALNDIEPVAGQQVEPEKPVHLSDLESKIEETSSPAPVQTPSIFEADENLPEAFKKIEIEAFKGNAEAQHDLAVIYTAGRGGVPQNFERAAEWFKKASAQGIANARYNLGVLHHQGLGVEQDLDQAIDWYQKAAQLGHAEAQYNLGIAHIEGIGVDYDPSRAAEYFESAAASGVPEAAFNLGLIYENGLIGQAQPDEAILWYKTAADLGNTDARNAMEQLAKSLNIKMEDIDALIERLKTPEINKQSQLSRSEQVLPAALAAQTSGMTSNEVLAQTQNQLISLGLFPGPADGLEGPLTSDAIRLYQARNDIPVTGEASEELLVHMLTKNLRNTSYIELGSGE